MVVQTREGPEKPVTRWHVVAGIAVALHLILALAYSVTVPPWEAHDEWAHYKYVEYIARHKRLPPQDKPLTTEYPFDEVTQPPLYYLLAALPLMPAVPQDNYRPVVNPYATREDGAGGVNMAVHDPTREAFPWRGTILGLHLARLASVVIGTLGLWFTWRLARLWAPNHPDVAALAVAFHALVPQYLFIGSVVTNDILLAVWVAATMYYLARVAVSPPNLRDTVLLGVVLTLAMLTKYLALALLVPGLIVPTVVWTRQIRGWRRWVAPAVVSGLVIGGGGIWLYRNVQQTGMLLPRDPYAVSQITARTPWDLAGQLPWENVPPALVYGFRTLWASFGWGNVDPGVGVTLFFALLCLIAVAGWVRRWRHRTLTSRDKVLLLVLSGTVAAVVALPLLRELVHNSAMLRGRYVLGILSAMSVWLALGWRAWIPETWSLRAVIGLTSVLVLLNIYSLVGVIAPAYRPPRPLSPAEVQAWLEQEDVQPVQVTFGDAIELVAFRQLDSTVTPGERAGIEVLWRVLRPLPENYTLSVQVLGRRHQPYGWLNIYPGRGTYPSTLWKPGVWFVETYQVPIEVKAPLPTGGMFAFAFFLDKPGFPELPTTDPSGRPVEAFVGRLRLAPASETLPAPSPLCPVAATWAESLALRGITFPRQGAPGQEVPMVLYWEALARPDRTWTVFVHLLTAAGNYVSGQDGWPQQGDFPTDLWRAGDEVLDPRVLSIPEDLAPGTYWITIGVYDAATGQRAPLRVSQGPILEPEAVTVAQLTVGNSPSVTLECVSHR